MKKINILIVDDHKLLSETWKYLLDADNRFNVIGNCEDGSEAITFVNTLQPDIIMMDINMPGVNGLEATQIIKKAHPTIKILGVSLHLQPAYAKKMIQKGAMGYITKNSPKDEMFFALLEVYNGRKYLCNEIKNMLLKEISAEDENKNLNILSPREIEIVKYIKLGNSSKEIAKELNVSVKTIEVHRYNILKKLKLKNSAELVNFANQTDPFNDF